MSDAADAESRAEYVRTGLLGRIAHELRGPAGVALGALDEVEIALEFSQFEKVDRLLPMVRRAVGRLLRTADKLDRAGQLERGRVEWAMETRDLREVVGKAAEQAEKVERRKGVAVTVSAPDTPCLVSIDADWITSAVSELVINAIRHARTCASVETSIEGPEVRVTIVDDGGGFVEAPGERFHAGREHGGLGLSLPLAQDVVHAHAGRLLLEVRPADGGPSARGRVTIVLPRATSAGSD